MRVLRISHSAVVTAWRGRERALRAGGVQVRLLSARRWAEGGRDVDLEPAPDERPGEDLVGVRTWGTHPNVFLYDPRPVWRALGERWDLIDLHEEPCALATAEILLLRALRRVRTPYVLYSAQNLDKRYPPPFRWWERRALRGAAAVSVCNAEAGRILHAKGLTAPAHVIGLGVELAAAAPATEPTTQPATATAAAATIAATTAEPAAPEPAPQAGPAPDAGVAGAAAPARTGYVGRLLAPHKGVDVLLDAAELDPLLHVAIAGAGPHEAALRRRAASPALAGRITFEGHLAGAELTVFYRSLDVLAVPSVPAPGWLEQFGRVAVEAMALGVPVVASDSGALRDVVGGAGVLVPPGDAAALADALAAVRDDPAHAARLRAAGTERARAYTWDAVGAAYRAMYDEVLGRTGTPQVGPVPTAATGPTPAPGDPADVEVVVVAYGAAGLLAEALAPVAGRLPVTVVDNSGEPAVRAVAEAAGVRYLDPGANLGFGSAVDVVLHDRLRPGADLLLLNPDARIDVAGVHALHRSLHASDRVAAMGPEQVDESGLPARVIWPFPSPAGVWRQEAGLGVPGTSQGFVIGSVLLLRAEALAEVGDFDQAFFLYSEETDWQRRAHDLGWRSAVAHDVLAVHVGGGTSSDPTRRETHFHAAQERYFRKHHGAAGWAAVRLAVALGSVPRSALPGDRGRSARLRLRLYLTGPLRAERAFGDPRAPRTAPDGSAAAAGTAAGSTTTRASETGTSRRTGPGTGTQALDTPLLGTPVPARPDGPDEEAA
ncbi:MAG TPA: glycosyltransferase [Cellulomonas sp.]